MSETHSCCHLCHLNAYSTPFQDGKAGGQSGLMRREAGSHLKGPKSVARKARPPPGELRVPVGDSLPVTFAHTAQASCSRGLTGQCLPLAQGCLTGDSAQASDFPSRHFLGQGTPPEQACRMRQVSLRKSALVVTGLVRPHAP